MLKRILAGFGQMIASSIQPPKQTFSDSTLEAPIQAGVETMQSFPYLRPNVLVDFHNAPSPLNPEGEMLLGEMDRVIPRTHPDRSGVLREAFLHGLTKRMEDAGRLTTFDRLQISGRAIKIGFGPAKDRAP